MKLIPIPKDKYEDYRLNLMFDCYKWDPQFLDHNTIARYALVLTKEEHEELQRLTEQLDEETRAAEEFLNNNQKLVNPLALPKSLKNEIKQMKNYDSKKHIRLMRYDFHPITETKGEGDEQWPAEGKWAISEVNSDVPGGFAEASLMPQTALDFITESDFIHDKNVQIEKGNECPKVPLYWYENFGEHLVKAIVKKVKSQGRIMMVHCTCYSDDRQVMQFLGDRLVQEGFQVIYGAADHIRFHEKRAYSILDGNEGELDAIIRFTPLEWLTEMKPKRWQGYFDTITVSCNHPVAIFAQTKRFPLIWDVLEKNGIPMDTWRKLLPDTVEVKAAKGKEGYIFKPACGRVGEKISIKEACVGDEYKKILADVKLHPKKYLAQKRFTSRPLIGENGEEFHVCLGSYAVDGKHAGYYARISELPRIDSNAADIPVLIEGKKDVRENSSSNEMPVKCKGRISREDSANAIPCNKLTDKEIFKIWAPTGKKWVDWVRPVPFVGIKEHSKGYRHFKTEASKKDVLTNENQQVSVIEDLSDVKYKNAALIVDLPGAESVEEGIALAYAGYRPIPVYNGTMEQQGARATVDNQSVGVALRWGAERLSRIEIKEDALPVFLLDSNRMNCYKMETGLFDNSWDLYHQDLPSAEYFLKNDIRKIIIIGQVVSKDLKKIFYPFQKKGIEIFWAKKYELPKRITIHKPFGMDKD